MYFKLTHISIRVTNRLRSFLLYLRPCVSCLVLTHSLSVFICVTIFFRTCRQAYVYPNALYYCLNSWQFEDNAICFIYLHDSRNHMEATF